MAGRAGIGGDGASVEPLVAVNIALMSLRKSLPSLGSFATFQVAARHLSFTRAADELNVTQAAISQQIRLLERAVGRDLFHRHHNAMSLTPDGAMLLEAVQQGLGTIGAAVDVLRGPAELDATITIAATAGVAHGFLWPLIQAYRSSHPEVRFVVLSSDEDDAVPNFEEVDLAIVCGTERFDPGDEMHFLFSEIVQPVASPDYLTREGPFETPESLTAARLLELHRSHWLAAGIGWQPLDWSTWFAAQGVEVKPAAATFSSNSYPLLMDAALASEGVLLGWRHLTQNAIDAGQLVHASSFTLVRERGNFLKLNPGSSTKGFHVRAFSEAILASAKSLRTD